MGLSDEGLFIVLVLGWLPLVGLHMYLLRRVKRLNEDVALVVFLIVLAIYTAGAILTILAGQWDSESSKTSVICIGEIVWLFSPLIASISSTSFWKGILPTSRLEWNLAFRRGILFGVPICFVFAAGDQILLYPVRVGTSSREFLTAVGAAFGYAGTSEYVQYVIGFFWNFTVGPFVDLFAPISDSFVANNTLVGTASYFCYAIPEEIGWAATLYPLLLAREGKVLHAMLWTGLVWGIWHLPYLLLKEGFSWEQSVLFVLSCVATRCLLTSLTWPLASTASALLEPVTIKASIFPAVFAHAALNVWWSFYQMMYPQASLWTSAESSLVSVAWQVGLAIIVVKRH